MINSDYYSAYHRGRYINNAPFERIFHMLYDLQSHKTGAYWCIKLVSGYKEVLGKAGTYKGERLFSEFYDNEKS